MQRVETVHPSLGARLQRWWGKGELGPGPLSLLMVLPALVFLLGIIAYPVLYALYLSFHEATLKGLASGVMPWGQPMPRILPTLSGGATSQPASARPARSGASRRPHDGPRRAGGGVGCGEVND